MPLVQPQGRRQLDGNDCDWIREAVRERVASGAPWTEPVSVVIPVCDRREMLARTLAALTHQGYPRELIQIVIADDGSRDGVEEVLERYGRVFDLLHVRQEDEGFRLAEVRNRATRAARHPAIVMLDCDLMPAPGHLEAFMSVLHVTDRALLLGPRRYVDANGLHEATIRARPDALAALPDLSGPAAARRSRVRDGVAVDWRVDLFEGREDPRRLTRPYRVAVGGNMAYPRAFVDEVGGYCEAFRAWGREDTEFGYRLYNAGKYFVPVSGAVALHQEPAAEGPDVRKERAAALRVTEPIFVERCPLTWRRQDRTRCYEVPLLAVVLPPGGEVGERLRCIDAVCRQTLRDLEIRVCGPVPEALARALARRADPRIRLDGGGPGAAAEDEAVARSRAPLVARVPSGLVPAPDALERLVDALIVREEGCLAEGPDPGALRAAWEEGGPAARARLLDRHLLLLRKRDWSRARWQPGAESGVLAQLPRVAGLRVPGPARAAAHASP